MAINSMRMYLYALLGVMALTAVGIVWMIFHSDYQNAVARERTRLTMFTKMIANNAEGIILRNRSRLERMAKRPAIAAMDMAHCDSILTDFRDIFPEFANLATIDPTGLAPCSGVPQPGGKPVNVAHTEWFRRGMDKHEFLVGHPFMGPITHKLVSVLLQPVKSESNTLLGFIGLPLDLERFSMELPEKSLAEGTRFGLLSSNGILIWRNVDPENQIGKNVADYAGPREALRLGDGQYVSTGTDNVERYSVVTTVPSAGWIAFMTVPTASIRQQVLRESAASITISIISLLLISVLVAFLLRRIALIEKELRVARDTAESANRAKSTFLANMSHELRTPMNAIMGMTNIALRQTEDPRLRDQLGKINGASQHLLHVINDILDISKIEAERVKLEQIDFRLGDVLKNTLSLVSQKASEKSLQLFVDLPEGLPGRNLRGDPMRFGQILLNLASNAVKFTEHGSVTLRCRIIEETDDALLLRWEVADTGIGIAPADQQKLFSAFEQADGSLTRKYGGTGLGLAISKRLVQMMGGEIGDNSTPGQGSIFWFTVRLGKAADGAVPPTQPVEGLTAEERLLEAHAGTRVLVAEDEPINQEVSCGLLKDVGLTVDVAEDGQQALELARTNRYALILMDMQMPNLNGLDATKAIRANSLNANTPILAMTANAFEEDRQTCLAAGMNDFISKPVVPNVLYETLLRWLPHD